MKTHQTKRIYRVRCKSGLMGWRTRLRNNYEHHHEWWSACQNYGLHKRLGYATATQAWRENPVIEGSVNPSDFRLVKNDTKTEHTPGPWTVGHSETEEIAIRCGQGKLEDDCIAVCCELLEGEAQANARLIASAPELLAACEEALSYRLQTHHGDDKCLALLRSAIAKAKGTP